jgi:hypothetical protein
MRERRKNKLRFLANKKYSVLAVACAVIMLAFSMSLYVPPASADKLCIIRHDNPDPGGLVAQPDPLSCMVGEYITWGIDLTVLQRHLNMQSVQISFGTPNPWSLTVPISFTINYPNPGQYKYPFLTGFAGTYKYTVTLWTLPNGGGSSIESVDPYMIVQQSVGGILVSIDKLGLLGPYVAISSMILVMSVAIGIFYRRARSTRR